MKALQLSNSKLYVLLDDNDYDYLISHRIFLSVKGYAQFNLDRVTTMVHRFVMAYSGTDQIDHINSIKLDCQKENLQILSASDNRSKTNFIPSKEGFRNVKSWKPRYMGKRKFIAHMKISGKYLNSKVFSTSFQAAVEAQNMFEIYRPNVKVSIPFEKGWVNHCQ